MESFKLFGCSHLIFRIAKINSSSTIVIGCDRKVMQTYRTNRTHKTNGVKAETCLPTPRAHAMDRNAKTDTRFNRNHLWQFHCHCKRLWGALVNLYKVMNCFYSWCIESNYWHVSFMDFSLSLAFKLIAKDGFRSRWRQHIWFHLPQPDSHEIWVHQNVAPILDHTFLYYVHCICVAKLVACFFLRK